MHKNTVWKGLYFDSISQAGNAIRMHNPSRRYHKNELVYTCTRYGTKFEIVEINPA